MLFPKDKGPLDEHSWAYIIEYDPMGYVKDDDANDIDYADLLADMQKDTEEGNADREKAGFEPAHLMGWGANPYYDQAQHALHWAKILAAPTRRSTTIIPGLLANVGFAKGQQYTDYSAGVDEVAAYTIGGLVAGKVLAKPLSASLALALKKPKWPPAARSQKFFDPAYHGLAGAGAAGGVVVAGARAKPAPHPGAVGAVLRAYGPHHGRGPHQQYVCGYRDGLLPGLGRPARHDSLLRAGRRLGL
nr:hypothetical protein [Tanacetum cinerariifolium]